MIGQKSSFQLAAFSWPITCRDLRKYCTCRRH